MDIEFHYDMTYLIAVRAGMSAADAQTLAFLVAKPRRAQAQPDTMTGLAFWIREFYAGKQK